MRAKWDWRVLIIGCACNLDTGLQTAEDVRMDTPVGSSQEYPAEEDKGQLSWASRISQATGATITKSQPPASTPGQVIQQPPPPQVQPQQPVRQTLNIMLNPASTSLCNFLFIAKAI